MYSSITLLNASTIVANGEANLYFKVEDGWGEYRLTITRPSSTDVITITDIVINSVSDEEYATADIQSLTAPLHADNRIYTLSGMRAKDMKAGNIYIKKNKKIFIN